jgi:hypothetical protein
MAIRPVVASPPFGYEPDQDEVVTVLEICPIEITGTAGCIIKLGVGSIVGHNCSRGCNAHYINQSGNMINNARRASWFGLQTRKDGWIACRVRPATEAEEAIWRLLGDGARLAQGE